MNKKSSSEGVGCLTVIGIVFVILKLTNLITWSWWWVLAPFWGQLAIVLILLVVLGILAAVKD